MPVTGCVASPAKNTRSPTGSAITLRELPSFTVGALTIHYTHHHQCNHIDRPVRAADVRISVKRRNDPVNEQLLRLSLAVTEDAIELREEAREGLLFAE